MGAGFLVIILGGKLGAGGTLTSLGGTDGAREARVRQSALEKGRLERLEKCAKSARKAVRGLGEGGLREVAVSRRGVWETPREKGRERACRGARGLGHVSARKPAGHESAWTKSREKPGEKLAQSPQMRPGRAKKSSDVVHRLSRCAT